MSQNPKAQISQQTTTSLLSANLLSQIPRLSKKKILHIYPQQPSPPPPNPNTDKAQLLPSPKNETHNYTTTVEKRLSRDFSMRWL